MACGWVNVVDNFSNKGGSARWSRSALGHPWRYIYYVAISLIGGITLIIYATFPETAYNRSPLAEGITTTLRSAPIDFLASNDKPQQDIATAEYVEATTSRNETQQKRHYLQGLKLWHGTFTEESVWSMALRPVMLLVLPPVLWATLVMSVNDWLHCSHHFECGTGICYCLRV